MEREIENSAEIAANTIEPIEKKSRNCAFDIARIVAMFLIVCSHFLGHGGFIRNMTGANFVFGRILTSLFNPSVNLFVLIGAYFTCTSKKLKWQRLAKLYAQVWIYGMTLFVVFLCIQGVESFSVEWLLSSIFPVVCGKYWFFSAYIFMMLVSPLLNIVIERINKKTHLAICVVSIVLGILAGDVHIVPQLAMGDGYNVIWFVMLYFIAAFIRKIRRDRSEKMDFHPDSCLYRNACGRIFLQHRAMFYRAFDSRNNTPYSTQRRKNELRTFVEIRHGIVLDYVRRLSDTRQQRNARLYVSKYFPRRHVLRFKVFFSHYARICGCNVCGVYRDRRDKTSHRQTTFKSR